jgi:hypothetical protein
MSYLTLAGTKLKYASIVWKLERTQRKFVALCQNRFPTHGLATYEDAVKPLQLHTLHDRRLHLNALFFISVCTGLKSRPSL